MSLEQTLSGWTGPSSDTEQEKQERTERMIREAVQAHPAFKGYTFKVYAKGSYANDTNVLADSDVDVAVQCGDCEYWEEAKPGSRTSSTSPYEGIWTPTKARAELVAALKTKFGDQVDDSGNVAIRVHSSTARIDADVVPCFDYRYYFSSGGSRQGCKVFPKKGDSFANYPQQQLDNGTNKNNRTNTLYKKGVRVIKRIENAMFTSKYHPSVPSFFMECLVYNCPDSILTRSSWVERVRGILVHLWDELEGTEPTEEASRWLEVNECKYLFHTNQKWTRADGRAFAKAAWKYLELG